MRGNKGIKHKNEVLEKLISNFFKCVDSDRSVIENLQENYNED